jgi:hypothetical protein
MTAPLPSLQCALDFHSEVLHVNANLLVVAVGSKRMLPRT